MIYDFLRPVLLAFLYSVFPADQRNMDGTIFSGVVAEIKKNVAAALRFTYGTNGANRPRENLRKHLPRSGKEKYGDCIRLGEKNGSCKTIRTSTLSP